MSRDLVNNIFDGDNLEAEAQFNNVMIDKVGNALERKREELAKTFNTFFVQSVKSMNINENKALLNTTGNLTDPVDIALKKFENHPSILDIKENVSGD